MINVLAIGAPEELSTLAEKLQLINITLTTASYHDIRIEIVNSKVEVHVKDIDILNYEFIWIKSSWIERQFADAISAYLTEVNIPHTKVEGEKSKLVDNVQLALNNIRIPNTFYCITNQAQNHIESIERVCSYPVIVKVTRGSLGKGIFLAKNNEELKDIIKNKLDNRLNYIFQQFIPNTFDYRILVSGQTRILSAEKRIRSASEFRNNVFLGAEEVFINIKNISNKLRDISVNSSKCLGLDWTGVDIIESTFNGEYYIIELNRRPGLTLNSTETIAAFDHLVSELTTQGLYKHS